MASSRPRRRPATDAERHACNVCRDRKVRCDRALPSCSRCLRLREECSYDNQGQSSVASQLAELQERLAKAEARLAVAQSPYTPYLLPAPANTHSDLQANGLSSIGMDDFIDFGSQSGQNLAGLPKLNFSSARSIPEPGLTDDIPVDLHDFFGLPTSWNSDGAPESISGEVLARLHDVYFEVSYPTLPIISRRRFYRSVASIPTSNASSSLNYAVALIGTTVSDQHRPLQQTCYRLARRHLELCEQDEVGSDLASIDTFQALVLVIRYEITSHRLERAWITIGRAIRLAKMLNLHQMDAENNGQDSNLQLLLPPTDDPVLLEERRRSFWGLYVLESYVSTRTGMPCHLGDPKSFRVRLQSRGNIDESQIADGPFFADAISGKSSTPLASYAGCILMVELALRCFEHSRITKADATERTGFWDRHYALVKQVAGRSEILSAHLTIEAATEDPMVFSLQMNMLALEMYLHQAAIAEIEQEKLPLSMATESIQWSKEAAQRVLGTIQSVSMQQKSQNFLVLQATFVAWPITMAIKTLYRDFESSQSSDTVPLLEMIGLLVRTLDRVEDPQGYWHASINEAVSALNLRVGAA